MDSAGVLEEENAQAGEQITALHERWDRVVQESGDTGTICPPSIDGFVLDVNEELHRVVIDKGRGAEVKVGFVFHVIRGSLYKGLVRIDEVQEDRSSGVILSEKNAIQLGDSACTDL
jgi:hypothetical protein